MTIEKARALIEQALRELAPVSDGSLPAPAIATPEAFDRALAAAVPGDVLALDPRLVYPAPLKMTRPGIHLRSTGLVDGRITRDAPAPRFLAGAAFTADATSAIGIEVRHTHPLTDIVTIAGARVTLDRVRILGDPDKGAKRGIAANGGGAVAIVGSYIDDCFQAYPGNDSQAICAWDLGPGLRIEDCYLSGGSETILIGGADPSSEARSPTDITIRRNTITKNPAWQRRLIGVKNALELKNARQVLIEHNDIAYSWGGHGQDGYLLMLTPRNQGGTAPYSAIEDVTIRHNRFAHGAAAIAMLGTDSNERSGWLQRVRIHDNTFSNLDPLTYEGSKRLILLQRGPRDVTIAHNVFEGQGHTSQLYFDGLPQAEQLVVTGNTWPKTKYGIFGSGATVGKAWPLFVASGTLGPNTET